MCWQNTNLPLEVLLRRLNSMLRGWAAYFKYGCSSATFGYLRHYLWLQVIRWIGRKHRAPLGDNSDAVIAEEMGGPLTARSCSSARTDLKLGDRLPRRTPMAVSHTRSSAAA